MSAPVAFPARLVRWRKHRGLSQFQLALTTGCSQRHVSFLELGRTKPSREMILRLAAALDVPLRNSNELLLRRVLRPCGLEPDLAHWKRTPVRDGSIFTYWPNKNHFRPWSWIDAGTCCKPIGALSLGLSSEAD